MRGRCEGIPERILIATKAVATASRSEAFLRFLNPSIRRFSLMGPAALG
ncbi:MAG: hypothetical protein J7L55_03130 [Desulfurococcales archaeon]|nr:hypothetical protein [Desulfurococcales archaeon]